MGGGRFGVFVSDNIIAKHKLGSPPTHLPPCPGFPQAFLGVWLEGSFEADIPVLLISSLISSWVMHLEPGFLNAYC